MVNTEAVRGLDTGELRRVVDKSHIQDALCRYARGVDRRDWDMVRSAFHEDATDQHGEYRGDTDGFIAWVSQRHARIDIAVHMLGNCLVEFLGDDAALVETYFLTMRPGQRLDAIEAAGGTDRTGANFGRYIDRFERRGGAWKIANRQVIFDAKLTLPVTYELRTAVFEWGRRDRSDPLYASGTTR